VPKFGKSMRWPLAGNRLAVKLAAQADGEITDIDDFLHLAAGFGRDLANFQRDKLGQIRLMLAKCVSDAAHQFAAHRRRRIAPDWKRRAGGLDRRVDLSSRCRGKFAQTAAINRRTDSQQFTASRLPLAAHCDCTQLANTKPS
jgi:hypothetical protein